MNKKTKNQKISNRNLVGSNPSRGRVKHDYYATPPKSTKAILDEVNLNGSILEPACGEGHISEVIKSYYPDNEIISTDLIDRGYGMGGIDFLNHDYKRKFDNIITNPPFKYMQEFTEKALELSNDKVLMFGKIQFLESKRRKKFFDKNPPKYVYVFSERQNPLRNGQALDENGKEWSSVMCFAWYVWEKEDTDETILRWI